MRASEFGPNTLFLPRFVHCESVKDLQNIELKGSGQFLRSDFNKVFVLYCINMNAYHGLFTARGPQSYVLKAIRFIYEI